MLNLSSTVGTSSQIINGDSRDVLKQFQNQVDLIVTSPPYADARKNHYDSVSPDDYAEWFLTFHEGMWNALKPTGSFILNIKDKVVNGVRHRYVWQTVEKLIERGWLCIDDYIWAKKNAMPGFWPSRLRDAWEICFHFAKCKRPYIDHYAVKIPAASSTKARVLRLTNNDKALKKSATGSGFVSNLLHWKNRDSVLPTNVLFLSAENRNRQHPAAFPVSLPAFFIKLLSPIGGLVLDPFAGSGSTGVAALQLNRRVILIDKSARYCEVAEKRLNSLNAKKECNLSGDDDALL